MRRSIHRGAIPLPPSIVSRCIALVSVGNVLELYTHDMVDLIDGIIMRMMTNRLMMIDLQSINRLCSAVMDHEDVADDLRANVQDLYDVIDLFIQAAYTPSRPCCMWS